MTNLKFTTLFTGPGVVTWFTRLLKNVILIFGPSNATPDTNDAKTSGAFGSSMNAGNIWAGSVMVQGTPGGGSWAPSDGGRTWARCYCVRPNV